MALWNTLVPIPLERARDVAAGLEQRVCERRRVLHALLQPWPDAPPVEWAASPNKATRP